MRGGESDTEREREREKEKEKKKEREIPNNSQFSIQMPV